MQLYFIRHGQSKNNALWADTRSNNGRSEDPELTELGIRQAEAVAAYLNNAHPSGGRLCDEQIAGGFGITHLYCSLMIRAVQTGMIISRKLKIPLEAWEELHEQGGIYLEDEATGEKKRMPGNSREFFEKHYAGLVLPEKFIDTGWWNRRPFEKPEESSLRAKLFLEGLREKHGNTEDRVAVISHGGFYNDILNNLLGISASQGWFSIFNTGISRINFFMDRFDILYLNRTDHLTPELIT
ncbi:MAG: histidine phosphatase family protein [Omnitrophica WOR_2 bacterium]